MDMPMRGYGLWKKYIYSNEDEIARRVNCERDNRLNISCQDFKTEGHRPCVSPEKYRPLTADERKKLEFQLISKI